MIPNCGERYSPVEDAALTTACHAITLLLCDCDGVLTDGTLFYGPDQMLGKPFYVRDGLGFNLWHQAGFASGIWLRVSEACVRAIISA